MIFKKDEISQKIEEISQKLLELSQKIDEISQKLQKIEERLPFNAFAVLKVDNVNEFLDLCADLTKKDKTFWFDYDGNYVKIYSLSKGLLISKLNWIMKNTKFKQIEIIEIK